ncbi:MAG: polysaccharide biosynthesis/export family protein [Flavobacteriales bacterium]
MWNHFEQLLILKACPRTAGLNVAGLVLVFVMCCTSCVPVESLIYLQPDEDMAEKVHMYDKQEYQLQTNDILDVKISSLNPEVNALFNASTMGTMQVAQATAQTGGDLFYITGYSIDQDGKIDIPFVGKVDVLGLNLNEAHSAVNVKVSELFTNYHLQVKLGGVRFSALGEFNRPGKHVVMQNQVTIFEAIALGGDLSLVANREQVRLIRQHPEGTKIHSINLLDDSVVGSPYYFIQPNDVLYAEPLPQRSWGIGITGAQTLNTIVSTLSTSAALILSIISLSR